MSDAECCIKNFQQMFTHANTKEQAELLIAIGNIAKEKKANILQVTGGGFDAELKEYLVKQGLSESRAKFILSL